MIDLASTLLVHVDVIDVRQNVSLFDETASRSWPTRNQTFHSKAAMITRMEYNSNTASFGLINCLDSGRMTMRIHVTWVRSLRRRGTRPRVFGERMVLMAMSLSAFDIHHIIGCFLDMILLVRIVVDFRLSICRSHCRHDVLSVTIVLVDGGAYAALLRARKVTHVMNVSLRRAIVVKLTSNVPVNRWSSRWSAADRRMTGLMIRGYRASAGVLVVRQAWMVRIGCTVWTAVRGIDCISRKHVPGMPLMWMHRIRDVCGRDAGRTYLLMMVHGSCVRITIIRR